jgi:tetratricopeptide (TPR) repeat protein
MNRDEEQRERLSVAMILVDVDQAVSSSLKSVRKIADEIVVVDASSSVAARADVAPLATQFLAVSWQNDFSIVRNTCLEATNGDWILWLEAGETLTEQAADQLRAFVDGSADSGKAYRLLVQTPAAAGSFAGLQLAQHRLIPRHQGLHFCGSARENLDLSVIACGLESETIDLAILRPALAHQLELNLQKARRILRICEEKIPGSPTDARLHLARAEALAELGEWDEARSSFQQSRQYAAAGSTEALESYYGELASYDNDLALREQQLNLCIEALKSFPVDVQLLCAMGNYLQQQQRIDLAARAYQTAVEYGKIHYGTWHLIDIADIATTCLSVTLELQDQEEHARAILENTLLERPTSTRMRHQLIDLHVRHGRRKEAIEQAARLPADWPHREAFTNAVRGACLAGEQNWPGAEAYLQTAFEAGCHDVLCLRWLSLTYAALENFEAAQEILDQWQAVEPDSQEIPKITASILTRKFNHSASHVPTVSGNAIPTTFHLHQPGAGNDSPPQPKSATATLGRQPGDRSETS